MDMQKYLFRILILPMIFTAGCERKNVTANSEEIPPLAVRAIQPEWGDAAGTYEFIANVKPLKSVKLQARIDGYLSSRHFDGGSMVKAGDLLYLIEPDAYALALKQAEAQLEKCRADLWNAKLELQRLNELFNEKIASNRQFDQASANFKSAQAQTAAATAQMEQAKLNLSYTRITAPFDGWMGLNSTDDGNYLSAPSQVLAEISYINQVKVEFHISDVYLRGKFQKALADGMPPGWEVTLKMPDGGNFNLSGKITRWENAVSTTTATLTVQALFDNPEHRLIPGLYVTAVLKNPTPEKSLLLDRRALKFEQGNFFAMVITPENILEFRPIKTGALFQDKIVIISGLNVGENVALTGNPLLRPGAKVKIIGAVK